MHKELCMCYGYGYPIHIKSSLFQKSFLEFFWITYEISKIMCCINPIINIIIIKLHFRVQNILAQHHRNLKFLSLPPIISGVWWVVGTRILEFWYSRIEILRKQNFTKSGFFLYNLYYNINNHCFTLTEVFLRANIKHSW